MTHDTALYINNIHLCPLLNIMYLSNIPKICLTSNGVAFRLSLLSKLFSTNKLEHFNEVTNMHVF
jgi:hypothetical protein